MRQIMLFVSVVVFCLFVFSEAAEPNFVKSTVYHVGSADEAVISTEYSDGLGRAIQAKQKLNASEARVTSTFYDDAGRPHISTKPFKDKTNPIGNFTPGDFNAINATLDNADNYYGYREASQTSAYAYSETEYYDDPLGRVKEAGASGYAFKIGSNNTTMFWYFGVPKSDVPSVGPIDHSKHIAIIENGFIKEFGIEGTTDRIDISVDLLNSLYNYLLTNGISGSDHFLTVTKDPDNKFTQELKDQFGRTVATRATNGAEEIIAEYKYDILGNLLNEKAPGAGILIDDSKYTYNTLGQLIEKTTPDGCKVKYIYDDAGLLIREKSVVGDEDVRVLSYTYDDLGRLTDIKKDFTVRVIIYVNNIPQEIEVDVSSDLVKNYYDDINALPTKGIPYYLLSEENLCNVTGRLIASVASSRVNRKDYDVIDLYSYDDEGRIKTKYKIIPGLPLQEITYVYDIHGKVKSENFKCGSENSTKYYVYNELGELKQIAHNNPTDIIAEYTNDPLGRSNEKTFTKISSDKVKYDYNIRGWLTSIDYNQNKGFKEELKYNEGTGTALPLFNGNIAKAEITYNYLHDAIPEFKKFSHEYFYDDVNRLKDVITKDKDDVALPGFRGEFNYDVAGRFQNKKEGDESTSNHDKYSYYQNNNRLKSSKTNGPIYIYDDFGNMIIDMSKKMFIKYDWRNMPIEFVFYNDLPVGVTGSGKKITPDNRGTISINDTYTGDKMKYIESLERNGQINRLSSVYMLYDASGKRVLKSSSN